MKLTSLQFVDTLKIGSVHSFEPVETLHDVVRSTGLAVSISHDRPTAVVSDVLERSRFHEMNYSMPVKQVVLNAEWALAEDLSLGLESHSASHLCQVSGSRCSRP